MCNIHWVHKWNNTQVGNAKDLDVAVPMYNLVEYSNNYSKTSGSLWQYYRNELHNTAVEFYHCYI